MIYRNITKNRLLRYPVYLKYLILKRNAKLVTISPTEIAKDLKISKESVRKDFQAISPECGIPKLGRLVDHLIRDLENFLGYHRRTKAIVIGIGHLGQAILSYEGFHDYGIHVVGGFDSDEKMVGKEVNGVPVYSMDKLKTFTGADVAIIAVPKEYAQGIADIVMSNGIKAIYNFSPVYLVVGEGVVVETIDIASSIAFLNSKKKLINGE